MTSGVAVPAVRDHRDPVSAAPPAWRAWVPYAAIAVVTLVLSLPMVWGGVRLGQDTATLFYIWYENLGERLRHGGIPEWNPYQFSGSPLAADPQSGWMYAPAMLLFTLLPLKLAIYATIYGHLLLANLGTYWLARRLGLGQPAALVAGLVFVGSGVFYGRIPSGPASYQVLTWMPFLLLGAEIVLQARSWRGRVGGLMLGAFSVCQVLSAWIGQVSYYTFLLLGAYLLFRGLWGRTVTGGYGWLQAMAAPFVEPSASTGRFSPGVAPRVVRVVIVGGLILVFGIGLNAAGLLPRLEFNAVSNLKGGEYTNQVGGAIGGSSSDDIIHRLFQPSIYYPGAAALVLAIIAVVLGRARFGALFWLFIAVIAVILTMPVETPVHRLFYLLPRFQAFHSHWPERVILVAFPGLAMLAGIGAQVVLERGSRAPAAGWRVAALCLGPVVLLGLVLLGGSLSWIVVVAVAAMVIVAGLSLLGDRWRWSGIWPAAAGRRVAVTLLALMLVVGGDAMAMAQALVPVAPFGGFVRRDVDTYYGPTGSSRFLAQQEAAEGPFRFAGYDPSVSTQEDGLTVYYRYEFPERITQDLIVNNLATIHHLDDVQGYNALRITSYLDVFAALNGGITQEYHSAAIYPEGIGSPLLNLLNLRYLIVPADISPFPELVALSKTWPTVYNDPVVRILRNPDALPRAWLVSRTETVADGQALPLLASGQVDPRQVAVFEPGVGPAPPDLGQSTAVAPAGNVSIVPGSDPDEMQLKVEAPAASVLMTSEIIYPAWRVEVDGKPAEMLTADHAFRGVAVPAGDHEVRFVYDSPATRLGMVLTLVTVALLVAAMAVAVWLDRRTRRDPGDPAAGTTGQNGGAPVGTPGG